MAETLAEKAAESRKWRGARRQSLREQIKAERLLDDMETIRKQCMENSAGMTANQVGALKLAADIAARQLAKVLPDVKAVEHDPGEYTELLQRDALNVRIAELYAAANSRLDGRGSAGAVPADNGAESTH